MTKLKIASLFAGCGGLDLGFKNSNFDIVWANEYDKTIWQSFEYNFPETKLDRRSILDISVDDIPDVDGIIGGPPCQSWSEAGAGRGENDKRGKLFWEYMRILESKKPKFFLAENVSGILSKRHEKAFQSIIKGFVELGYDVFFDLLNANDYGVAQDRQRVIIIGFRKELGISFNFPDPIYPKTVLSDIIRDLSNNVVPALPKNYSNPDQIVPNHEYMVGGFSTMYMSRNRVRGWDEPSFTIQAGGRHAPLHPQAPKMIKVAENNFIFDPKNFDKYRRLSIRECLRIQDFPDNYRLVYKNLTDGYKMVGNAVPVGLAYNIAETISKCLNHVPQKNLSHNKNLEPHFVI